MKWGRGSWQEKVGRVLGEEGEGEEVLKELEEARRTREGREEGMTEEEKGGERRGEDGGESTGE